MKLKVTGPIHASLDKHVWWDISEYYPVGSYVETNILTCRYFHILEDEGYHLYEICGNDLNYSYHEYEKEPEKDNHEGMIYNPITDSWGWL